ncbi:MAG: hypothetical protein DRJ51_03000 [Thermoprotei archaeon]|nr:MAG: hypothetical protein DRJ51_03000 [Thermoprotei archaeon]RLF02321.1 MAG: hypothetical protein DRJ59_03970 [Thermoprotei archaeon]
MLEKLGERYTKMLEIDVDSGKDEELFKWLLASILYGSFLPEKIATRTYLEFRKRGVLTPQAILNAGWEGLVEILDSGGYVRLDFKTAYKLSEVSKNLIKWYDGSLNKLHEKAQDSLDLENRIKALGKGVGHVTTCIFLRELREVWPKADPSLTKLEILAASNLGLISSKDPRQAVQELRNFWERNKVPGFNFISFETAILRLGKDYCKKSLCKNCFLSQYCVTSRQQYFHKK